MLLVFLRTISKSLLQRFGYIQNPRIMTTDAVVNGRRLCLIHVASYTAQTYMLRVGNRRGGGRQEKEQMEVKRAEVESE